MAGNLTLDQDFKEFIESLNALDVRYLVVGGYALAVHGRPRYTKDLDIWFDQQPDNAEKLVRAIERFGFQSLGLKAGDFLVPNQVIQLGNAPIRIDLLTSVSGIVFDQCFPGRVVVMIDELPVNVIDLENLKKNKRASGRLQDLADVEALESSSTDSQ